MSTLERALEMAARAHAGQRDRVGQPYVLHVLRVMFRVREPEERIVAVLHDAVEDQGGIPGWAFTLVDTLNDVLPRYKDLDKLTTKLLSAGTLTPAEMQSRGLDVIEYPSWASTFGVSLAFIALMLGLACWRFQKRDS